MQTKFYKEDKGIHFGKWTDLVSKFMYFDSTAEILNLIQIPECVADYGGANGNLKAFIPQAISIDVDSTKNPDINQDILEHNRSYDLVVIRFVLHYLNDYEVIQLFKTIKSKHILVIQFTNEDLLSKYKNSVNEHKYFRTKKQLTQLLPQSMNEIYSKEYTVNEMFYQNRLGKGNYMAHKETLKAFYK